MLRVVIDANDYLPVPDRINYLESASLVLLMYWHYIVVEWERKEELDMNPFKEVIRGLNQNYSVYKNGTWDKKEYVLVWGRKVLIR